MIKKIEGDILGYVNVDDVEHPFLFDNSTYKLSLYPLSAKCGSMDVNALANLKKVIGDIKKPKWIDAVDLKGVTVQGYNILFNVSGGYDIKDNLKIYTVNYVYYYEHFNDHNINGLSITGEDIDGFFSHTKSLDMNCTFDDKAGTYKNQSLKAIDIPKQDGGTFILNGDGEEVFCRISLDAYSFLTMAYDIPDKKMESISEIRVGFSDSIGIKSTIECIGLICNLFRFLSYRLRVDLDEIHTYCLDEDGIAHYDGRIIIRDISANEYVSDADLCIDENDVKKSIIRYDDIKEHTADICTMIYNGKISLEHMTSTYFRRNSYNQARILGILTAFERAYNNIYGIDTVRGDDYVNFKNSLIERLNKGKECYHGKQLKWYKDVINGIKKSGISYSQKVYHALIDNQSTVEMYIKNKYEYTDYKKIADDISKRIGKLRNNLAHNNKLDEMDANIIFDIKTVEELWYCMYLRHCNVPIENIVKAVGRLFKENQY